MASANRRTGAPPRLAAAALLGAAMAGCGFLIHAGDYAVGDGGSDATTEAAPGDDGGETETAADDASETGATAAVDGDASGRDAAPPPTCGQGLPDTGAFADIVRACTLTVSCDPFDFNTTLGGCITDNFLGSVGSLACLKTIQDCNGYFQCQGHRMPTSTECPPGILGARCDAVNNVAIDCLLGLVQGCGQLGGTCGTYTDTAGNTHADCVVVPSCTETDENFHCSGNSRFTCHHGVGFGQNCALSDSTCNEPDGGGPSGCHFDGPPCGDAGYACQDNVLSLCSSEQRSFTYDCPAGLSCTASRDRSIGTCLAPGCTSLGSCPPQESCGIDGRTLTVCVGGAPYTIDCTQEGSAGFTHCGAAADSNGVTRGLCQ